MAVQLSAQLSVGFRMSCRTNRHLRAVQLEHLADVAVGALIPRGDLDRVADPQVALGEEQALGGFAEGAPAQRLAVARIRLARTGRNGKVEESRQVTTKHPMSPLQSAVQLSKVSAGLLICVPMDAE
jgi:hypothetical protein